MDTKKELYEEIAEEIRTRVKNKTYSSAQKLPSEYQLAEEFLVSRLTIRKAIDVLIRKQILVKQKGKGTYIMQEQEAIIQSGRGGLQSFTEAANYYGLPSVTKLLHFEEIDGISTWLQDILELTEKDSVYHVKRVRQLGETPMTIEDIYFNTKIVPGFTEELAKGSLFDLFEKHTEIAYSHQEVEAKLVDATVSELLGVAVHEPVFLIHSTAYAASGEVLMYDTSYYRADKYTLKNTLIRNKN